VDGGSVYVLTSYLKLCRLNVTDGAVIWSTNLIQGFGGSVIGWQNAASPVLENGLIFVNANCGTSTLMAINASDGTVAWRSQNEAMTHSTPVLATIHGVRQLIFATQSGLVSVDPQTGGLIWKFVYPFSYSISLAASPTVHGDAIFVSGYYNMGSVGIQILQSNSTLVPVQRWRNASLESHWSTPVCRAGALFGPFEPDSADAALMCINMTNGAVHWSVNGFGRGAPMLVGTNLVVITERGDLVLAVAHTNAYTELGRFRAITNFGIDFNKCWNALALSDGQVYVRSTAYAARFDLSVPDLRLELPRPLSGARLELTIRTASGTPLDSNRLTGMELRATTNMALSPATWPALTNNLVLTNGVVTVTNIDAVPPRRYFIVAEPE
jgi:outer membrane protein assembly factor BamB